MAMRRELDVLGFGGSAALMAATMGGGALGDVGYAFSDVFYSPLGVAAWGVVGWLADETLGVLLPRDTRASLFRRARWAAGTWLGSVGCALLGDRGGWIGAQIAVPLHITLGVGSYALVGAGVYALARSCWPQTVDEMTTQLHATVVRTGKELGGAWQQARQLEAQRRVMRLSASNAGVAPQRQPVRVASVAPKHVSRTRPVSYADIIDVPCEVVSSAPAYQTPVKRPSEATNAHVYRVPNASVLAPSVGTSAPSEAELKRDQNKIWMVLGDHGCIGRPTGKRSIGPVVVTHQVEIAPGNKLSKLAGLTEELSLELGRPVRVAGNVVEVPRADRQTVALRSLVKRGFSALHLPVALGVSATGEPVYFDLAQAPHVLVAGTTGSGKSVGINVMLTSLLLSRTPAELRLVLIDPKRVELSAYRDIPHLLAPVATETADAEAVLSWAVDEMERRYTALESARTKSIEALSLPRIVVVVDEYADLSAQSEDIADHVQRLAQKARAAGIHLVVATQHPIAKTIGTLIKNNVPTRVCFRVANDSASRVVLDEGGAESLLGNGDSLCILPGQTGIVRVHGAFVSDDDVAAVCDAWRSQGRPDYVELDDADAADVQAPRASQRTAQRDLYAIACAHGRESGVMSVRAIMRACSCGYDVAAGLYARMEDAGLLGDPKGKARTFLG